MSDQIQQSHPQSGEQLHGSVPALVLGAIGVVFGDIGTSPLYTMQEVFLPEYGLRPMHSTVLGVLSLVTWALITVVAVKYVSLMMRADNKGEGGIMALMTMAQRAVGSGGRKRKLVMLMALLGAALFFGDGVITPSISVLSAVEGLEVVAPHLEHWVVPLAVLVLLFLFWLQRHGTAKVGALFGPICVLWFSALAVIGVWNILQAPEVLWALDPIYAIDFFKVHGVAAFIALGAVVLCVTGAEALYTDMGHFGRKPIRVAWFFFVMPALLLNYYGQGGLLLHNPDAISNPFYHAVPDWASLSDDRPGHGGGGDRLAGGDLRRVLGDPPGHPAGFRAAHEGGAHLARGHRTHLPAVREPHADGGGDPHRSCCSVRPRRWAARMASR